MRDFAKIGKKTVETLLTYTRIKKEIVHNHSFVDALRLTRSQMIQFLYYHFLPVDSNGFIKYVSISKTAEICNLHVKTVKRNLDVLQEAGLIDFTLFDADLLHVYLVNYRNYVLKKEDGGSGYVECPKTFFHELVHSCKTVNMVRFSLACFIKYDSDRFKTKINLYQQREEYLVLNNIEKEQKVVDEPSTVLTSFFHKYVPKYARYHHFICEQIKKITPLFTVSSLKEGMVSFALHRAYVFSPKKANWIKNIQSDIRVFLSSIGTEITEQKEKDFVSLAMQYGSSVLKEVFILIEQEEDPFELLNIENISAYVRTKCQKYFFYQQKEEFIPW